MISHRFTRWQKKLLTALLLLGLGAFWLLFAPTQLGGDTTYVVLTGNSMSPKFKLGDLVLVRAHNYYQVGDIVAYRHPDIGLVFHRIVALDETGHFVMQGDHNDWTDSYHPAPEDIVGRFWLQLPGLGTGLRTLRTPLWMALIAVIISILFILSFQDDSEKKKNMRVKENRLDILFFWGVLLAGGLILGLIAFRAPRTLQIPEQITYQESVDFSYSAHVSENVYDESLIQPGEPIFRKLNDTFTVHVRYQLTTSAAAEVTGTYRLLARISDDTGWKRTTELVGETPFSGTSFQAEGVVDLNHIQAYIDALEEETDFQANRYYLDIILETQTQGTLDGHPLQTRFSPTLKFQFSPLEVHLVQNALENDTPLQPSQGSLITYEQTVPNSLHILGLALPVDTARGLALLIALPSLIALALNGYAFYKTSRQSELGRIRLLYGHQIIQARDMQFRTDLQPVEVASIEDLAMLAEQDEKPIIYLPEGSLHHFFVQSENQIYHYRMADIPPADVEIIEGEPVSLLPDWLRPRPYRALQSAYQQAMQTLAENIDRRFYDEGHAKRVAELSRELAQGMGLPESAVDTIYRGAYLHDIGLNDIPEEILLKNDPLGEEEWQMVRNHPKTLPPDLNQLPFMKPVRDIIYYHHERWDGSGYPEGLQGSDIPLGARIVAVADVWDALSHPRPYRPAWDDVKILDYFCEQRGVGFDPVIVDVLCRLKGRAAAQPETDSSSDSENEAEDEKEN